jgi:peptidoglycan/xylan/chitin deacetylase (PgdA/CDA1 family)
VSEPGPRVALTFDAEHPDRPRCPPGNAERILDTLRDAGVRATFFVQGRWARSQPGTARRIAEDGHLVGHHSNHHAPMTLLSDEGLREDVTDGAQAIVEIVGADPRPWFRCPFGAGHEDPRVLGALEELGYRNVHWDVELEDWEPWRTAEEVANDAVKGSLAHGDGAVVLMHTWPEPTAGGLPSIVSGLASEGVRFVTVDELERLP